MDKFFSTLLSTVGQNAQGFAHGLLAGLSPVVAEKDKQALDHQYLASEEIAKQYDLLAQTAFDPQHAAQFRAMSTAIRTTPYGKKPPAWALDTYGTMQKQIAAMRGQSGSPQPGSALPALTPPPGQPPQQSQADIIAQGPNPNPALPLPPPPGANTPDAPLTPPDTSAAVAQATYGGPQAPQPAPQSAAQPAMQPPPGQSPTPAPSPAPQAAPTNAQAQQIGLGSQPGTAGGGFTAGVPNLSPFPSPYRTPESAAALSITQENAKNEAELKRAKDLSGFQHKQELETIYALSGRNPDGTVGTGGSQPITWSTTAAGHTIAKPDLGHPVPGIVLNAQGQPVRLIRYSDPTHYPDREIPVPNYSGSVLLQKADGTAGWFAKDKSGNIIDEITTPGAVAYPPASYGTTDTNTAHQEWVDVGDHKELKWVAGHTERTKRPPSMTPPPSTPTAGGPSAGGGSTRPATLAAPPSRSSGASPSANAGTNPNVIVKTLTPVQELAATKQVGALDNTIDILSRIQKAVPLFTSLVSAAKIQVQTDPKTGYIHALIARNANLSPEEAQAAADLRSMAEHINTLRGPLGATGFRGADAFANLLSQGGSAMGNPEVTARMLQNTMKALMTQKAALDGALNRGNSNGNRMTPPPMAAPPTKSNSDLNDIFPIH